MAPVSKIALTSSLLPHALAASLCMDVPDTGMDPLDGEVQIWGCNGYPNQQWDLSELHDDGLWNIKDAQHGYCLTLPDGDTTNGNRVQLQDGCIPHPMSDHTTQEWLARQVVHGKTFDIRYKADPSKCLDAGDATSGGMQEGFALMIWDCNKLPQQVWGYDADMQTIYLADSRRLQVSAGAARTHTAEAAEGSRGAAVNSSSKALRGSLQSRSSQCSSGQFCTVNGALKPCPASGLCQDASNPCESLSTTNPEQCPAGVKDSNGVEINTGLMCVYSPECEQFGGLHCYDKTGCKYYFPPSNPCESLSTTNPEQCPAGVKDSNGVEINTDLMCVYSPACEQFGGLHCYDKTGCKYASPTPAPPSPPSPGSGCKQLYGTYCAGGGQQCDCDYCDDFSSNDECANTCRVMNGYFSSPFREHPWAPVYLENPVNAADGTDCSWMKGNGYGGKGDDCKSCDEYAMACRRANPPRIGATYAGNSGGNCRA
jgi:hypothetical protein